MDSQRLTQAATGQQQTDLVTKKGRALQFVLACLPAGRVLGRLNIFCPRLRDRFPSSDGRLTRFYPPVTRRPIAAA